MNTSAKEGSTKESQSEKAKELITETETEIEEMDEFERRFLTIKTLHEVMLL